MNDDTERLLLSNFPDQSRRPISRRATLRLLGALGLTAAGGGALTSTAGAAPRGASGSSPGRFQQATAAAGPPSPPPPQLGPQANGSRIWRVQVGAVEDTEMAEAMAFLPDAITINAGDAIYFDFRSFHTASFLSGQAPPPLVMPDPASSKPGAPPTIIANPAVAFPSGGTTYNGSGIVNSGIVTLLPPGTPPFTVTFTKPGVYQYLCLAHPKVMTGTVTVQERGATLPHQQADYDAMAAQQWAAMLADGAALIARYNQAMVTKRGDGTALWDVVAGAGDGHVELMRFLPDNMTVKVGDTVRWTRRALSDPHTVTFSSGAEPPDLIVPEPSAGGQPKLVFNAQTLLPAGGNTYRGTGYVNSGFLGKEFNGPETYELTFATPGTYTYYCAIHGSPTMGMRASITVNAA